MRHHLIGLPRSTECGTPQPVCQTVLIARKELGISTLVGGHRCRRSVRHFEINRNRRRGVDAPMLHWLVPPCLFPFLTIIGLDLVVLQRRAGPMAPALEFPRR